MAVRQALREWFEAVRSGSEGVHGAQLVDAVVTLGLNHDLKQVTTRLSFFTFSTQLAKKK